MQSKLFRFEIEQVLVNPVFQAMDPNTGEPVFLYEWTPAKAEREAAKQRLEEVAEQLSCEVFTADASLYLAAPSRAAGSLAIATLQEHELFPGDWLERPSAPAALPPPMQEPPALAAPFVRSGTVEKSSSPSATPYPVKFSAGEMAGSALKPKPAIGCLFAFLGIVLFCVIWANSSFWAGLIITVVYFFVIAAVRRKR